MDADYPFDALSREPAPPYAGEPGFALWHYSENPDLGTFRPRVPATNPDATNPDATNPDATNPDATNPAAPPLVWAVDSRHAPLFWFPRDCPRGCIWPVSATTAADRERFFGQSSATRIHVIEAHWLGRMQDCRLYAYKLPSEAFRPHAVGGYWVSDEPVNAIEQVIIDDLPGKHVLAGIELRVTPSIWPFWRRVTASTVEFSGCRLRNAVPHPPRSPAP